MPPRAASVTLLAVAALAGAAAGAEREVGPGRPYATIEAALAGAQPGDTLRVHPLPGNRPYEGVAVLVRLPRIAIVAAGGQGGRVPLSGRAFDYSGRGRVPRAVIQFDPGADGGRLEGFDISGAHNGNHNGAGVRINQANRTLIRDCAIHGNDMGIMSNGDGTLRAAVDQRIERCLIHSNGDPADPGYNHNLYLGGASVTLLGCEVHSSLTGHNVKSRAHRTVVLACYVHDSANREFDLVDAQGETTVPGSDAVLAGNVIVKAAACAGNRGVIHFGQDGGREHDGALRLVHNTIVTPYRSPVVLLSASGARAELVNNIVWDQTSRQEGQVLVAASDPAILAERVVGRANAFASGFAGSLERVPRLAGSITATGGAAPRFADAGRGDYRLLAPFSGGVDGDAALDTSMLAAMGTNVVEYLSPQGFRVREWSGRPDLGAHEYEAAP